MDYENNSYPTNVRPSSAYIGMDTQALVRRLLKGEVARNVEVEGSMDGFIELAEGCVVVVQWVQEHTKVVLSHPMLKIL